MANFRDKEYGLIIPGKKGPQSKPKAEPPKPSIFGSDSESDDDGPPQLLRKQGAPLGPGATAKRMARKIQEKALEEDPTVFQYDELYDEMENKREEEKKAKSTEVKKAKYISRLMEFAEKRKIDNERRIERQVQKEREEEGDKFKDKESFVTSAYRKKMEEMRKAEELEKREEYLEAIGDVTKQKDLDGFYRHLYEQKLGSTKTETEAKDSSQLAYAPVRSNPATSSSSTSIKATQAKSRAYRKRKSSEDEEEVPQVESSEAAKKAHIQSNLDADSDFSIDSSDSEDEEAQPKKAKDESFKVPDSNVIIKKEPEEDVEAKEDTVVAEVNQDVKIKEEKLDEPKLEEEDEKKPPKEKKPKIDIWAKRTVGDVFDAALQRYYERKAGRG